MIIERFVIPKEIKQHRFFREIEAELDNLDYLQPNKIIGTQNVGKPELFGWIGDIDEHHDNQGFSYFCPLTNSAGTFHIDGQPPLQFKQGDLIRFNDHQKHSIKINQGSQIAICLFVGCYEKPNDTNVIKMVKNAISELSTPSERSYHTAPRWLSSKICGDECFIEMNNGDYKRTLTQFAQANKLLILNCSAPNCNNVAVTVDKHHPYHMEYTLCHQHKLR